MDHNNRWELVQRRLSDLLDQVVDDALDLDERNEAAQEIIRCYFAMMERAQNIEGVVDAWAATHPEMRADLDKVLLENPLPVPGSGE